MPSPVFQVEIKGMKELTKAFEQAPQLTKRVLSQAVSRSADILASHTVPGVVPYRTGQLIQTFRRRTTDLTARWFPTVKYAPHVQFGTRPHTIVPTNGKALYWKGAAHPVRKVNHPGSRANPFMDRILSRAKREIDLTFKEALDLIVKNI